MRHRKLPFAFALLFTFVLAASTCSAQEGALPDAYSPEPSFNFEPIVEGGEVTHDFIIANRGEGMLTIAKVKTG